MSPRRDGLVVTTLSHSEAGEARAHGWVAYAFEPLSAQIKNPHLDWDIVCRR